MADSLTAPPNRAKRFSREWRRATRVLLPDRLRHWTPPNLLRLLILVAVAALIAALYLFRDDIAALASEEALRKLGYVPVFVIPLIGSASILLPLPGAAVIFLGGALLAPLAVGLVAGTAESLGELTGYAAGYGAGAVVERGRRYQGVVSWMRRHGAIVLFFLSVIPNPIFDLAGMAAGTLRYPLWRFFLVVLAGKIVKDTALALAGAWGARGLADYLAPLLRHLQ